MCWKPFLVRVVCKGALPFLLYFYFISLTPSRYLINQHVRLRNMQAANLVWVTDVKLSVWAEPCRYAAVQIVNHFGYFIYFVVDWWELLLSEAAGLLRDTCHFHTYLYSHYWHHSLHLFCLELQRDDLKAMWGKNDSYWGIMRHHWHLQNIFIELYSLSGELLPFLAPNKTAAD